MQTLMKHLRGVEGSASIQRTATAGRSLASLPLRAAAPEAPAYQSSRPPSSYPSTQGYGSGSSGTLSRSYGTGDSSSGAAAATPLRPETRVAGPSFGVYKGKGALQLKVIPPTWGQSASGYLEVIRDGVVLLEFATLAPGQGTQGNFGARSYAWDKKVMFSLRATEAALVTSPTDLLLVNGRGVEMVHDPSKGGADEGKVFKKFTIGAANPDGSHFFSVSQRTQGVSEEARISVPVTYAEFHTIRKLLDYALPRLLGFDVPFENNIPHAK